MQYWKRVSIRNSLLEQLAPQRNGCAMDPATSQPTLKFGPFVVDLHAGELRKFGARVRLQEKPLQLLAALAKQSGQVVTRDELRQRLWPGDTFVDFETGLNTAVSKLRDALSDSAENPRFIETIPRRGYRFLFPVEIVASNRNGTSAIAAANSNGPSVPVSDSEHILAPLAPAVTIAPPAEDSSAEKQIEEIRSAGAAWIRATIATAAVLLILIVWWLTPLPDPRITEIFSVTQTGRLDYLVRPATDGARIFYVQRAGDHYDLMQASTNGGEAQKLAPPFPNTLIWDVSPDGSKYLITSFARRGGPAPLWSWPSTGGSPVKLGDIVSGSASFSPDGKEIVYHVENDLLIANADGTGVRKLGSFSDQPDSPVWSPDGRSIRFNRNDPDRNTGSIWEIAPDGSNLHPVLPNWQDPPTQCCGTWTPDGRYFIFVDSQPSHRLYALREKHDWWRRSPPGPFLLAAEASGSWSPLISRDGKHVYYYGTRTQSDIETLDPATQQFSAVMRETRPAMLSISHDRQWVSYIDFPSGVLWISHFDGSESRKIQFPGMRAAFPRLSPDNKLIAFTRSQDGALDNVSVVSAGGGTPRAVVSNSGSMSDPDWSPDGSRLVVVLDLQPAQPSQPASTLAIVTLKDQQVLNLPGSEDMRLPRWSPDGRYIAALRDSFSEMRLLDTSTHTWTTVAQGKNLTYPVWSADGADLYFQDLLAPGQPLFKFQIATSLQTQVASFQKALDTGIQRCSFVGLSPDGAPIIAFDRSNSDIYGARLSLP
jgi:Tol biopolymer transport system component/DNA-binding winged helix-turn-helix (wHTH) protein